MIENPIKQGLKVQIEVATGVLPNSKTRIDCYIVKPEFDRLTLRCPENITEYTPYLSEGKEIKAFIYTFSGIFIVNSIVLDELNNDEIVIEFNEEHQTIQRRKYQRASYETDMYVITAEGNIKMQTKDISGGGIRFLSKTEFKDSQKINIQLRLSTYLPLVKADGVILKKSFFAPDEYVVEFTQIEESMRTKIIEKCEHIKQKRQN